MTPRPRADATRLKSVPAAKSQHLGNWAIAAAFGVLALVALAVAIGYWPGQDEQGVPPVPPSPGIEAATDRDLAGWIVMSWTLRGTGKADLWLFQPDGGQRIQITDDPQSFDVHPNFSPDGRRIAFIRGQRT